MRKSLVIVLAREKESRKDIEDNLRIKRNVSEIYKDKGINTEILYMEETDFNDEEKIKERIKKLNPFCVFNLFEGFGNDAKKEIAFAELMEEMQVPFTGNSSRTLGMCLDKGNVKKLLRKNNIPVPKGIIVKKKDDVDVTKISFPVFIKPCCEDASLGIDKYSLVDNRRDLYKAVGKKLKRFPGGLVVEEFISGREYNAGFLGDYPYEMMGISTIDYSKYKGFLPFLTYRSKWKKGTPEYKMIMPVVLKSFNGRLKERVANTAIKVGKIFKCRSYFRVDFREKEGVFYVLDINPNPDINKDSGFMRQAYTKGYDYKKIVEKIVRFSRGS